MPLIQGRSKKAFKKNVETEMSSGKPQKQSLAIAYSVKRRNAKKMADGGIVSAANEKRPMPDDLHADESMARRNSNRKPQPDGSWLDNDPMNDAQRPSPHEMQDPNVPDAYEGLSDDEDHLMDSMPPSSDKDQPKDAYNEEGADRQGPSVPDMEREHSNGRKPYAQGGEVEDPEYMQVRQPRYPNKGSLGKQKLAYGGAAEDTNEPSLPRAKADNRRQPEDEYMSDHFDYFADGGEVSDEPENTNKALKSIRTAFGKGVDPNPTPSPSPKSKMYSEGGNVDLDDESNPKLEESHKHPIASAILRRRKAKKMADGGMVDLSSNADESPNNEDQMSYEALKKENYSETPGLDALDQPMDSNEHGRDIESDVYDMVDSIRRKMKSYRNR